MININDQNKEHIIQQYASFVIDSMDWDSLWEFARSGIVDNLRNYDNDELKSEISEFYPYLLEQ